MTKNSGDDAKVRFCNIVVGGGKEQRVGIPKSRSNYASKKSFLAPKQDKTPAMRLCSRVLLLKTQLFTNYQIFLGTST